MANGKKKHFKHFEKTNPKPILPPSPNHTHPPSTVPNPRTQRYVLLPCLTGDNPWSFRGKPNSSEQGPQVRKWPYSIRSVPPRPSSKKDDSICEKCCCCVHRSRKKISLDLKRKLHAPKTDASAWSSHVTPVIYPAGVGSQKRSA